VLYDAKNNKKSPENRPACRAKPAMSARVSTRKRPARRRCLARLVRNRAVGRSAVQISIIKKVFYHD
jgi:hypothetical protein